MSSDGEGKRDTASLWCRKTSVRRRRSVVAAAASLPWCRRMPKPPCGGEKHACAVVLQTRRSSGVACKKPSEGKNGAREGRAIPVSGAKNSSGRRKDRVLRDSHEEESMRRCSRRARVSGKSMKAQCHGSDGWVGWEKRAARVHRPASLVITAGISRRRSYLMSET